MKDYRLCLRWGDECGKCGNLKMWQFENLKMFQLEDVLSGEW